VVSVGGRRNPPPNSEIKLASATAATEINVGITAKHDIVEDG
jgi:hypothetical protein